MPKLTAARYEENFPGTSLSDAETEFALAMERYMRLKHRPFPTWHEVLAVALSLGYRRVACKSDQNKK
jgi:hypothetical protein